MELPLSGGVPHGRIRHLFTATGPNEIWLTDINERPTREGKRCLCAVKDVYSNRIVGHSIDIRMRPSLARAAISNAIALRDPDGTICHSDRGSQFRSRKVTRILRENGLKGWMDRVGAAGDNASMESFCSLLRKNVLSTRTWDTRDQLRYEIVCWIEVELTR